jgi:acyl carrier protein phosphodiesterase
MNYLAHFYLSFGQEPLVVGNLLGDFVRGGLDHERNAIYDNDIKKGIDLHRKIDFFTDTHTTVKVCHAAMPVAFGHIKGVVSDMYFDYFLAKFFADYSPQALPDFTANVYQVLEKHRNIIPVEAMNMVESMTKYDWLTNYQYPEGMSRSFAGMAKKYKILKGIECADEELFKNEAMYEGFFRSFFEELKEYCVGLVVPIIP